MTTNTTKALNVMPDMVPVGKYLELLAKANKKTQRTIAKDTGLSVNSVKAVFNGVRGNIGTYETIAAYLGTTFVKVVIAAHSVPNTTDETQTTTS